MYKYLDTYRGGKNAAFLQGPYWESRAKFGKIPDNLGGLGKNFRKTMKIFGKLRKFEKSFRN